MSQQLVYLCYNELFPRTNDVTLAILLCESDVVVHQLSLFGISSHNVMMNNNARQEKTTTGELYKSTWVVLQILIVLYQLPYKHTYCQTDKPKVSLKPVCKQLTNR